MKQRFALQFAILFCISMPAMAHTYADAILPGWFLTGIFHPLAGADHLLAALAAGLLAARYGRHPALAVPFTFLCGLLSGFIVYSQGLYLPHIEQGIALSLMLPGLALAVPARVKLPAILLVIAVFSTLHGYAHATEMHGAQQVPFIAGLLVATSLLHACGIAIARAMQKRGMPAIIPIAGSAIAMTGGYLLFA